MKAGSAFGLVKIDVVKACLRSKLAFCLENGLNLMEFGAGRLLQIAGAVIGVIGLAWLLTKYVEEPAYRALASLRVRGLGARAFAWLNT